MSPQAELVNYCVTLKTTELLSQTVSFLHREVWQLRFYWFTTVD